MATPNASYSVRFRVEVANRPGVLGRLTPAIGEAGGNINGVPDSELSATYVVPSVFSRRVAELVASGVAAAARAEGVVRPEHRHT